MTTGEKVLDALRPFGLKKDVGEEWRCNNPFVPGSDSMGFRLKVTADGEHGTYHDKVRDEGGSLYDLAAKLGIETPKNGRVAVPDTKRSYRDLADYAAAHGVTVDVLKGWSDVATYQERPALAFKTPTGLRYRFIDGDKPYYKSEYGYKACWYGLRGALSMTEHSWLPLILCNGEVSTLVAQHYGLPACCVTGGERQIPPPLIADLRALYPGGEIMLVYDCDETGRKTAAAIKAQLTGYEVRVIDLRLGDKGDLADFCMLHGANVKAALMELSEKAPTTDAPALQAVDPIDALVAAAKDLSNAIRQDERDRDKADLEVVLAKLRAELDRVTMNHAQPILKSFAALADENMVMLDYMRQHPDPIRGLRSRIPSLDKAIGGFTPEVYVIYGATGMGKSTLGVSILREFIKQAPGLIVSTESPPGRYLTKLVASICKVSSDKIESGQLNDEEYELVKATYRLLKEHNCHILDAGSPTPGQVRAGFLAGLKEWGYQWCLIDSGSKMSYPGASAIYDRTSGVANGIQDLYREANVPVIVTSQIGRDVSDPSRRGKRMPLLEDAYGSGVIEHNAGVVIGLYFHQYYVDLGLEDASQDFPPDMTLARILKNRWNPGGRTNGVRLKFMPGAGFYEMGPVGGNFNDL